MSSEIKQTIQTYLYREQRLLVQYDAFTLEKKSRSSSLVSKGVSLGVGEFASWLLESSKAGRYSRSLTKQYLDLQTKEQLKERERALENQHSVTVQSLRSSLETVSIKKKSLKEPNSSQLLTKLDKAQNYVKLPTRIRKTIGLLIDLSSEDLIYNIEIPEKAVEEVILSPGKPFTAMIEIRKILSSAEEYVNVIDPYVDHNTLDLLLSVSENISIKVITAYTGGSKNIGRFLRECKKFKKERPTFDIRKCDPSLIHDRFILTETDGWSSGSSLKDVGKSLSMIKQLLPENLTLMYIFFDNLWRDSMTLDL